MVEKKYVLFFDKQAKKDKINLERSNLKEKARELVELIEKDPFGYPPPYKYLNGDMSHIVSRRINNQHRIYYTVDNETTLVDGEEYFVIRILGMWTHYHEGNA